MKRLSNALY